MPNFNIEEFFPANFFKKETNEKIHIDLLCHCLKFSFTRIGNPNIFEPDVFLDKRPFELTLACNRDQTRNFINFLRINDFSSQQLEDDICNYIYESVVFKSKKHYSTNNTSLSILVPVSVFDWFLDDYGSLTACLMQGPKNLLFKKIKENFLDNKIFENIYILMQGYCCDWFCWSISNGKRTKFKLNEKMVNSKFYPYTKMGKE